MRLLLVLGLLFAGCDYVERPRRPIAEHFRAETLTGEGIDRDSLKGRPWLVNIWLPG